ncbi:hypothetical protein J3F83DRAFT_50809 [Trichoderma novae-zelandiae]
MHEYKHLFLVADVPRDHKRLLVSFVSFSSPTPAGITAARRQLEPLVPPDLSSFGLARLQPRPTAWVHRARLGLDWPGLSWLGLASTSQDPLPSHARSACCCDFQALARVHAVLRTSSCKKKRAARGSAHFRTPRRPVPSQPWGARLSSSRRVQTSSSTRLLPRAESCTVTVLLSPRPGDLTPFIICQPAGILPSPASSSSPSFCLLHLSPSLSISLHLSPSLSISLHLSIFPALHLPPPSLLASPPPHPPPTCCSWFCYCLLLPTACCSCCCFLLR